MVQIKIRLSEEDAARLDVYARALSAHVPGSDVSRSHAARACVIAQLDALDLAPPPAAQKGGKKNAPRKA